MENFTPVEALVGGGLIGLGAALLLALHGRICGVSGIFGNLLMAPRAQGYWGPSFILGLLLGGIAMVYWQPEVMATELQRSTASTVVAGLCVGFGAAMGGGCTSGHGVCGNARLSGRSMVATITFIITGAITVYIVRTTFGGSL